MEAASGGGKKQGWLLQCKKHLAIGVYMVVGRRSLSLQKLPDQAKGKERPSGIETRQVVIPQLGLGGTLSVPRGASALVTFAHGSGSSRFSPRNRIVAEALNECGVATLLFDLLTTEEESDRANVFDIPLLAGRLADAVRWLDRDPTFRRMAFGLFGAGAAAALVATSQLGRRIGAVVSRGGRPDLAGAVLDRIEAPTLLIVGGADYGVVELNEQALVRPSGPKALEIVPGGEPSLSRTGRAMEMVITIVRPSIRPALARLLT